MGAQKTLLDSLFFVNHVLRSGIENDECMTAGIKAVEGLLTPLLPRYLYDGSNPIMLGFLSLSCLECNSYLSIWLRISCVRSYSCRAYVWEFC